MNKQELSAMIAEILSGMGKEPMVKGSDYKATQPEPQPENPHFHAGDFVPDVTELDLRRLFCIMAADRNRRHLFVLYDQERHVHHGADDGDGVLRFLREAKPKNTVHTLGVAIAAYIMTIDAPGLTWFLLFADGALHKYIFQQVFQWSFTNQAFFIHSNHSRPTNWNLLFHFIYRNS